MRTSKRAGQALVEFSLVAVLLFTVFCAIIEFSWAFYNLVYLNNAVSKAARVYVANDNALSSNSGWDAARISLVSEQGGLTIIPPSGPVLYDDSWNVTTARTPGGYVKLTGSMVYPSITPLNSFVQAAGFGTLRAEAVARIE